MFIKYTKKSGERCVIREDIVERIQVEQAGNGIHTGVLAVFFINGFDDPVPELVNMEKSKQLAGIVGYSFH